MKCIVTFTRHLATHTDEAHGFFKGYFYWVSDQLFEGFRLVGYEFVADKDWPERNVYKGHEHFWFTSCLAVEGIIGLCCYRDEENDEIGCELVPQGECADLLGFRWMYPPPQNPTDCTMWCDVPVGRCCIPPNTPAQLGDLRACSDGLTECDCEDLGGFWAEGAVCDGNPIPTLGDECNPIGRCCDCRAGTEFCEETTASDCRLLNKFWDPLLTCATPCEPLGACCKYKNVTVPEGEMRPVLVCQNTTCAACGCIEIWNDDFTELVDCICEDDIFNPPAENLLQQWAAECVMCTANACCPEGMDIGVACCFGVNQCTETTACDCGREGGTYVRGIDNQVSGCRSGNRCPYATCCGSQLPDDPPCLQLGPQGESFCNFVGGLWLGYHTYCSNEEGDQQPYACEGIPPTGDTGACCYDGIGCSGLNRECRQTTSAGCQQLNGKWHENEICDGGFQGCCVFTPCCFPGTNTCFNVDGPPINCINSGGFPMEPGEYSCVEPPPECT